MSGPTEQDAPMTLPRHAGIKHTFCHLTHNPGPYAADGKRKTSAHPSEATYPCCIPALGELGDVTPCGGVCEYTPMAGTTRISCAQQFTPCRHGPLPDYQGMMLSRE